MQTPTQYEDDYDDDGLGAGSLAAMLGAGAMATPLGRPVRKLMGKANTKLRDPAGKAAAAMSGVTKPTAEFLKKNMGGGALDRARVAANDAARARGGNPVAFGETLSNAADTYKGGQAGLQSIWSSMKGAKPNLADSVNPPPVSTAMVPSAVVPPNVRAAGVRTPADTTAVLPPEVALPEFLKASAQARGADQALARNVTPPVLPAQPEAPLTAALRADTDKIVDVPDAVKAATATRLKPEMGVLVSPRFKNMELDNVNAAMRGAVGRKQRPHASALARNLNNTGAVSDDVLIQANAGGVGDRFTDGIIKMRKKGYDEQTLRVLQHAGADFNKKFLKQNATGKPVTAESLLATYLKAVK